MGSVLQEFPAFDEVAQREIAASAKELLNGLWIAYLGATRAFHANPTTKRWRERVRAHAAWAVASRAEDGEATCGLTTTWATGRGPRLTSTPSTALPAHACLPSWRAGSQTES